MSIASDILAKILKPTALGSKKVAESWSAKLRAKSIFSAKVSSKSYLDKLREIAARFAAGEGNKAEARAELISSQEALGMPIRSTINEPDPVVRMQQISSKLRMDLQLETIRGQAKSMSQIALSQNPVLKVIRPAWRFKSNSYRKTHRNWPERWQIAGNSVGWVGAAQNDMVALKDSPIWAALGSGQPDSLNQAYPPFAFQSSYGWVDVNRDEAIKLGLIKEDKQ